MNLHTKTTPLEQRTPTAVLSFRKRILETTKDFCAILKFFYSCNEWQKSASFVSDYKSNQASCSSCHICLPLKSKTDVVQVLLKHFRENDFVLSQITFNPKVFALRQVKWNTHFAIAHAQMMIENSVYNFVIIAKKPEMQFGD